MLPQQIRDNFSKKLRELRRKKGISQAKLAELIDMEQSQVSRWESGTALPEKANLDVLADCFGVTPEYFFRETKPVALNETADETVKIMASMIQDIRSSGVEASDLAMIGYLVKQIRFLQIEIEEMRVQVEASRTMATMPSSLLDLLAKATPEQQRALRTFLEGQVQPQASRHSKSRGKRV
jgi:transcriptional regulator with XRE-family HTH domain